MGSAHLRGTPLPRILAAGLVACFLTSCGGADVLVPAEEPADTPTSLADVLGPVLYRADGTSVGIGTTATKALVGLYFSAGWCPACGSFTPVLVTTYNELRQAGKSLEIVLVSLDYSSTEMFAHMTQRGMPWLATPHSLEKANALARRFGVEFIPTLVVLDDGGAVVSTTGRQDVVAKGAQAYDDWLTAAGG